MLISSTSHGTRLSGKNSEIGSGLKENEKSPAVWAAVVPAGLEGLALLTKD
jgi:hypothetical protein